MVLTPPPPNTIRVNVHLNSCVVSIHVCKPIISTKVSEGLGRPKGESGQVQKQLEKERAEHRRKVDKIETDLDTARADNQVSVILYINVRSESI